MSLDDTSTVELPVEESIQLIVSNSSKTISAFAFDNSGLRFAAGGHDHELHIWDFEALDKQHPTSICDVQPCGQTIIKHVDFSPDDELILIISGGCQAVVVAKDGIVKSQFTCPKGDQYISDMTNTKGHVQMLNDGCWNPREERSFITCSNDCTVRIWDLNTKTQQKSVIKTRSPVNGLKTVPNVCKFSRDALSIVVGCNDGSIMMWDTRRKFITTSACIRNAHLKGSEITGLAYAYGANKMCTRSEDESCKVWDLRQLKQAIATQTGLTTLYSTSDCSFSPDDKFVITGTSSTKKTPGQLLFLDSNQLSVKRSIDVADSSVIRARWQPKINHVGYSCSNGTASVLYDTKHSMGGLLAAGERGLKRKKYVSNKLAAPDGPIKKIITPHALPLFRDDQSTSTFAKLRQDPKRTYMPELPITGASEGGRVKPAGSTLSSYIARNIAKPIDDGSMNIRDRILRHAEEAQREPFWFKPSSGQQQRQQQQKQQQPQQQSRQPERQPEQQQQHLQRQQKQRSTPPPPPAQP